MKSNMHSIKVLAKNSSSNTRHVKAGWVRSLDVLSIPIREARKLILVIKSCLATWFNLTITARLAMIFSILILYS